MHTFGFALALLSCWVVAEGGDFPSEEGKLDRALQLALARGAFVPWKDWLVFLHTSQGLRCKQVGEALVMAQMTGLLWYPQRNLPRILLSSRWAAEMLSNNKISITLASEWGKTLIQAVAEV